MQDEPAPLCALYMYRLVTLPWQGRPGITKSRDRQVKSSLADKQANDLPFTIHISLCIPDLTVFFGGSI